MKKTYLAVLTAAGVALTACGSHTAPEATASEAPQTEAAASLFFCLYPMQLDDLYPFKIKPPHNIPCPYVDNML